MQATVSIVIPCFNEEGTIRKLLDALYAQTYPRDRMQLLICDGMSTDGTREAVRAFRSQATDLSVQIIENPKRTIPAALNAGIRVATGDVVVRLDAHCVPYPDYIERAVTAVMSDKGENVGGVWEIRPGATTPIAEAIAAAAGHPLGAGDALYRLRPEAAAVDTVPFGSFRRQLVERVGLFDESLLSNEDYEFNARIRQAGGTVWLDPQIRSVYFARSNLRDLARQYWRYGFWKWRMLRRHPRTIRLRQALPPVFAGGLVVLAVLSLWSQAARLALLGGIAVYMAVLGLAGLLLAFRARKAYLIVGLPACIAVMHFAWAGGFLWSVLGGRPRP